ncbi:MAG: CapA family protein [Alphaproteobacteria bacterium]|nr:CapA family protein [Alphaproteobacteria bacterium]
MLPTLLLTACASGAWDLHLEVLDAAGAPVPDAWVDQAGERLAVDRGGVARVRGGPSPEVLLIGAPGFLTEPVPVGLDDADLTVTLHSARGGRRAALHFGGDVMLGRRYQSAEPPLLPDGPAAERLLAPLGRLFGAADLSVLNLETVVGDFPEAEPMLDASVPNTPDDDRPYPGKRWVMASPPEVVDAALATLGADLVVLANNHQRDWEETGVRATLRALGCAPASDDPDARRWMLEEDRCVGGGLTEDDAAVPAYSVAGGLVIGTLAYTSVDGDFVNDQYPLDPEPGLPPEDAWLGMTATWGEPDLGVPVDERTTGGAWRALQEAEAGLDAASRATLWASARDAYPGLQDWGARRGHGGANLWDAARAQREIARLAEDTDLVVVQLHAGFQFAANPSEAAREAAFAAIDAGADLVIAHHPHVLQGIEHHGDGLIAWSLGNLAFDQDFLATFPSAVLRVVVDEDEGLVEARLLPVWLDGYQPAPVVGPRAAHLAAEVQARSLARATAARGDDLAVRTLNDPAASETPALLTLQHNTLRIDRWGGDLRDLTVQQTLPADVRGVVTLPGPRMVEAAPGLTLGRELLAVGGFEDDAADGDLGRWRGWVPVQGAVALTDRDAAEGRQSLELVAAPGETAAARMVARVSLPAHRLYAEDLTPLDGEATYSLRLQAWVDGDPDAARARLDLYHFDDLDPLHSPQSALLYSLSPPLPLARGGWQGVTVELPPLEPVNGLLPNAALLYLELDDPARETTLLRLDAVELVEWRTGGTGWVAADHARDLTGPLRWLEIAP